MNGYRDQRGFTPILFRLGLAVLIAAVGGGMFIFQGCQRGPFNRRQIVAVKADQEAALGAQAFREVMTKADVIERGPVVDAVNGVARRLIDATTNRQFLARTQQPEQPMQWAVRVVRSKEMNAFCLPGGKIVVYTGILPVCATDAGLATVMGHEIAHALAHHGAERMAQQRLAQIAITAAGTTTGDMDPRDRDRLLRVLNAGAQFGILRYSRSHESEADQMGLYLMATAGYDPRESVKFWERMKNVARGGSPPEFLSTHPSHETRIRDLERWMPEAVRLYRESGRTAGPEELPRLR